MPNDTAGVKTLENVVQEFMFKSKRPEDEYHRMLQFAIDGLREMRMFHLKGVVRWAKLTLSSINTIAFPSDYASFVGVCVPVNGQYWFLTEKGRIIVTTTSGGQDSDKGEGVDINDSYFIGYPSAGGINQEGYYKIDDINRRIFINSTDHTEVILLYNSSGVKYDGTDTYVPVRAVPAIHAHILYNDYVFSGRMDLALAYRTHLDGEVDKLKYLESPSYHELRDALWEVTNSLPQR